ncbi:Lrp/AsnC family transcriptional regulator [Monaibacterium marinum]|uniref:Lrp/AsnC family transcriptional regulator n=1 Tax=Pontivivens marinum TaxID=1690039 RepID=UPI000BEFECE9|nr:Lrp/AsnC family transcriptional regulator [Monaibacterium marinum]
MDFDAQDVRILTLLQRDGRQSNAALAEAANLSASACHRRVRRLEASGVISGYGARLDPVALGRRTVVYVEFTLMGQSQEVLDAFEDAVAKVPDVVECHLMAGAADYLAKVMARDSDDFARIHREHLSRLPGVAQMQSSFALRTVRAGRELPVPAHKSHSKR